MANHRHFVVRDALINGYWREGKTRREIADLLEMTVGAVGGALHRSRLRGEDLAQRKPGHKPVRRMEVGRRAGAGESDPEIAAAMGICLVSVRRHRRAIEGAGA